MDRGIPGADRRSSDELEEVSPGLLRWRREVTSLQDPPVRGFDVTMDFRTAYEPAYRMIPAVSYDGNPWGTGGEPKGFTRDSEPWVFASHRTSVSGCTYSEGVDLSVALFGSPGGFPSTFSCSLVPGERCVVHRLLWPEEESPLAYVGRDRYAEGYRAQAALRCGDSVSLEACLVIAPVSTPRHSYRRLLDEAWRMGRRETGMLRSPEELWQLGMAYVKDSLWAEEGVFRGCSIGLQWVGGAWRQRPQWRYELGWCGQNGSLAASLIWDYVANGDRDSLERGLAILDCWVRHGRLANGLIRCHFDYVLGLEDPAQELQDACNLGQGAVALLEAWELAARAGTERPEYCEAALALCSFAVSRMQPDGRLGKAWRNDGSCVDPDGTIGAFLIPALLRSEAIGAGASFLDAAERAYRHYADRFMRDGFSTAGALDTHCIDKESAIPLLESGLLLHARTGRREYLEASEHAAYYLASWQWHHSPVYPEGSSLAELGYDAWGGTSVSTQHHHQDPYGLAFVNHWLRLAEVTGDPMWRERARAVWRNGTMGISDGGLVVMGKLRPKGSQDEGFMHTRWGDAFNVSQWLVAWPTAFRLETLRRAGSWDELR